MQFIISNYNSASGNHLGKCILVRDSWDDFSFKTTFYLKYIGDTGSYEIGRVKIMQKDMTHGAVSLPDFFTELPANYCSLGQGQSYYEQLMMLDKNIRSDILISLNDCVYNDNILHEFVETEAFKTSLLRNINLIQIEKNFKSILQGQLILSPYDFSIILDKENKPQLDIHVTPHTMPPSNVHVIIGRNASGKTQLLSALISNLTDEENAHLRFKVEVKFNNTYNFINQTFDETNFSKLIAVIFSPFDNNEPPHEDEAQASRGIIYNYIGLRQWKKDKEKNKILLDNKSPATLHKELKEAFIKCCTGSYKDRFEKALTILSSDPIFAEHNFEELINTLDTDAQNKKINNLCKELSSGHKIILLSLVKLVELTEEKTLVLIDEPENHLHPPLLSAYLRALSELMRNRNGVAIIATHSPVVLQEVPQSCVHIIDRYGDITNIRKPRIETFGENVSTLTHEVFGLEVMNSGFYNLLAQEVGKGFSYDEIIQHFNNMLGTDGQSILRSLIYERDKNVQNR
ncbi:MAG: AAA family ATPase [Proteobacteria bacterium]|nr:AAA family ATPase [Pseudomonadota bacterium]